MVAPFPFHRPRPPPPAMTSSRAPIQGVQVADLHDTYNRHPAWPDVPDDPSGLAAPGLPPALHEALLDNHRCNARLWCEEDLARRRLAPDAEIVANKRHIDAFNQARNNAIERLDEWLLLALGLVDPATVSGASPASLAPAGARLNSETAGSMVDRLSILSLKLRAMAEQTVRTDVDEAHRADARARLARLQEQRRDLAGCLDELLADCLAGRAHFKVYRQFKMYNDPAFNRELVRERQQGRATPAG